MPFEKVSGSGVGSKISLRKSGTIGINEAALAKFFDDKEYAEVYYDENANQIGMRPMSEKTNDSYTISKQESGATLSPTSFLKAKSLIPDVTTRYEPFEQQLNEDVDLVVIDLDEPVGQYGNPDDDEDSEED